MATFNNMDLNLLRVFQAIADERSLTLAGKVAGVVTEKGRIRSRAVLILQLWQNGLNIVLDLWFVLGLGWGIEGVAVATLIAEVTGLMLALWLARDALTPAVLRAGNSGSVYFAVNGKTYGPAAPGASVVKNVALSPESLTQTFAEANLADDADLAALGTVAEGTEAPAPPQPLVDCLST